jgi:hypothetical protein
MVCILVLTSQDIDLKPSFANILICLVSITDVILGDAYCVIRSSITDRHRSAEYYVINRSHLKFYEFLYEQMHAELPDRFKRQFIRGIF